MLAVQLPVELTKHFSRQRIDSLIAESPTLRDRVKPARSRDAANAVLSKDFPAGLLANLRERIYSIALEIKDSETPEQMKGLVRSVFIPP